MGGVLFVDEAYALVKDDKDHFGREAGSRDDVSHTDLVSLNHYGVTVTDHFGREALDTLMKLVEDRRDDLVVILAGYKDEMNEVGAWCMWCRQGGCRVGAGWVGANNDEEEWWEQR